MPRKTQDQIGIRSCFGFGFNEAAARCRGKPAAPAGSAGGEPASMRPRPDAAENPNDRATPSIV